MVESTTLVVRQFMTKTCKKAININNNYLHKVTECREKPSTDTEKGAKEASGEVTRTAPTPEQQMKRRRKVDGLGETQKEAPVPEPACKP